MSKLKQIREKHHLTQEELAEKSGISVRTIQRIEAGVNPKGYTLKTLAKVLEVSESDLVDPTPREIDKEKIETPENSSIHEDKTIDYAKIKIINLSSILFVILPPLNILVPLLLSRWWKQKNELIKEIISVQIIWTILAPLIFFIGIFMKLGNHFTLVLIMAIIVSNLFLILSNNHDIDKYGKMRYKLNFNII